MKMSVLTSPYAEDYISQCTKECGVVTTTQDCTYFALNCMFCSQKFYYFDAFIAHIQTDHGMQGGGPTDEFSLSYMDTSNDKVDGERDERLNHVKKERPDESAYENGGNPFMTDFTLDSSFNNDANLLTVKSEPVVKIETNDEQYNFFDGSSSGLMPDDNNSNSTENDDDDDDDDDEDGHYDDLVEETLLCAHDGNRSEEPQLHIKDKKMITYIINAYRKNTFLWDNGHPKFRDRVKRQRFIDCLMRDFKTKFNMTLARDAITRKWDNLRTVYKREITRMVQEKSNVSTLWYFKEMRFLNKLYCKGEDLSDTIVNDTLYRRRFSAVWNDKSTHRLLELVRTYPCFYDKYHGDYRSKEKRGEALHKMVDALKSYVVVNAIQISKRISQLRFDYSKQKQERLVCELHNKPFLPTYGYYAAMRFMDEDIAPFKCEQCPTIMQTVREREFHVIQHQPNDALLTCEICNASFEEKERYIMHKQLHWPPMKEAKNYSCELCRAAFTERLAYEEHVQRHNDDLLLPDLSEVGAQQEPQAAMSSSGGLDKTFAGESCLSPYASHGELMAHLQAEHEDKVKYKCDYANCQKEFTTRYTLLEHIRQHYSEGQFKCDVCAKIFRSVKSLSNHRQIHDAIKRYVCKICGSAFAQAAGLYLHKRRHNRPNGRLRDTY